jgi:DNA-binding winged helix-turn-helix (wHTH) protein
LESSGASGFRFEGFHLDVRTGELRRDKTKLRVADQALQILALLVKQAGEVVTREELKAALWPDNTTVEFDHSINTAINRLRQALGDSAEKPRLIETLPRRGYRFIAPVEADNNSARTTDAVVAEGVLPEAGSKRRRSILLSVAALGAVLMIAAGGYWILFRTPRPGLEPQVIPFTSFVGEENSPAFSPDGVLSPLAESVLRTPIRTFTFSRLEHRRHSASPEIRWNISARRFRRMAAT